MKIVLSILSAYTLSKFQIFLMISKIRTTMHKNLIEHETPIKMVFKKYTAMQ